MSDEAQKPVEEPVAAPTSTETTAAEPATESKPAEEAPKDTTTEAPAAEATQPASETPAAPAAAAETPAKKEAAPIDEGVLGYKAPGLLKSFIFTKKFFWFGSEPIETKHLSGYLRGEKPEVANHNAAWASHTGNGLLFFSKKSSEKTSPGGVINLSEAADVNEDGPVEFHIKVGEHKHTFQATTLSERNGWVTALKAKIAEAKELGDSVTNSETYKKSHSSLSKPLVAAAATPKKSSEVKKEEKAEAKEEKKEEKAEKKEEKDEAKEEKKEEKVGKARSGSRKRNSIFGTIGFGKKEEKKEEAAPAAEPAKADVAETAAAPAAEGAVTGTATGTEAAPATEETTPAESKPATSKRNSIFGTLKSQFSSKPPQEKKTESEAAPEVPAKDAQPVSETAPVIPAVESTEPLSTSVATPATVPTETPAVPVTNGETKDSETPAVRSDKRKSSLPWLSKKDKPTSDDEAEKPKSPFAKLRATVKGKSSPKAEKAPEKTSEAAPAAEPTTSAAPASTEPAASEPVASEPTPAAPTSTPQVAATA